jgi:uncharacterized protein YndB with AHSA1/START domain
MSPSNEITATVTHTFAASPEKVFDAWITGEKVREWFAPGMGEMVRVAIDARLGGAFSFVQRRGMDDVDHLGKYIEFARPDRLAFTWLTNCIRTGPTTKRKSPRRGPRC